MYCSTCGQKLADHLNYCNSCGARVEKSSADTTKTIPANLFKGPSVVLMMGFVGFIAVLKLVLDNPRLDMPATVFILVAYLAALIAVTAMFIGFAWKQSNGRGDRSKRHDGSTDEYVRPVSFRGSNTNQLGEPTYQPVGSVTDSTTRTLDEVHVERR